MTQFFGIEWTAEIARAHDTRSLRIYREEAVKAKRNAEEMLSQLTPPEEYEPHVGLFRLDLCGAEDAIAIIEAELTSRGLSFE